MSKSSSETGSVPTRIRPTVGQVRALEQQVLFWREQAKRAVEGAERWRDDYWRQVDEVTRLRLLVALYRPPVEV
jgi:hypothetical protein